MRRRQEVIPLDLPEPTATEVERMRAWLTDLEARSSRATAARWTYLVITPLGMWARSWLEEQLGERGIQIELRRTLEGWPRISTAVQVKACDPRHLRRAVLFEAAWRTLVPQGDAEAWAVDPRWHSQLAQDKAALRKGLRNAVVSFRCEHAVLHALHLANPEDAALEARRLETALQPWSGFGL